MKKKPTCWDRPWPKLVKNSHFLAQRWDHQFAYHSSTPGLFRISACLHKRWWWSFMSFTILVNSRETYRIHIYKLDKELESLEWFFFSDSLCSMNPGFHIVFVGPRGSQVCCGKGLSLWMLNMQKILKMGWTSFRLMKTDPFYFKCSK